MKTWYHSSYARTTRSLVTVRLDRGEIDRIVMALDIYLASMVAPSSRKEFEQEIARTKELLAGFRASIQ